MGVVPSWDPLVHQAAQRPKGTLFLHQQQQHAGQQVEALAVAAGQARPMRDGSPNSGVRPGKRVQHTTQPPRAFSVRAVKENVVGVGTP